METGVSTETCIWVEMVTAEKGTNTNVYQLRMGADNMNSTQVQEVQIPLGTILKTCEA